MRKTRRLGLLGLALLASQARVARAAPEPPPVAGPVLVAAQAKQPCPAVGPDGTVYVACLERGNVVVAVSTDGGRTFGEPRLAIDAQGRARGGAQRGPRLGVDARGQLVVTAPLTFDPAEAAKTYPAPEIYLATSADGGGRWTAPVRVNEVEKQASEGLHAMRVAADGTVHVAWLDRRGRGEKGQDLWYARVVGGQVGPNVRLAQSVCECCAPGLALDGAGNPLTAWREGGAGGSREVYAARSKDGGATFAKAARLNPHDTKEDG